MVSSSSRALGLSLGLGCWSSVGSGRLLLELVPRVVLLLVTVLGVFTVTRGAVDALEALGLGSCWHNWGAK